MVASKRRFKTGNRKKTYAKKQHAGRKILSTSPVHCFQTDVLDHAETEPRAYYHVVPVLQLVSKHFQIKPKKLQIWDPYFCKGTMVKHLADLGFHSVRNVNEDFYRVQQTGVPESGQTTWFWWCKQILQGRFWHVSSILDALCCATWFSEFKSFWFCKLRTTMFSSQIRHIPLTTWNGASRFAWNLQSLAFCCCRAGLPKNHIFQSYLDAETVIFSSLHHFKDTTTRCHVIWCQNHANRLGLEMMGKHRPFNPVGTYICRLPSNLRFFSKI